MKKIIFGLLTAAALCVNSYAGEKPPRLQFCCDLKNPPSQGTSGKVLIPGEVFDRSRNFPNDLRILDQEGTQWPFFIMTPADRTVTKKQEPQILNMAFVEGETPHWHFDLILPEKGGLTVHNQIEIQTGGNDFVRRVAVFQDKSERIGLGYLIQFPENSDARNRLVSYPSSDARRLHVRVFSDAKNATEQFEITSVAVYFVDRMPAEREEVYAMNCPVPDNETKNGIQTLLLDTGFKNRPVEWLTFEVENASFVRSVSVYGRNNEKDPWVSAGGGQIHRFQKNEETAIKVSASYRWIKADIRQDDDPPLIIPGVRLEAIPRYAVFEAAGSLPARLCFGGLNVRAPEYDLKKRLSESFARVLPVSGTGDVHPDPLGAPPAAFQTYSRIFVGIAIGAVSLLTVWVIIRMMRKTGGEEKT